MKKQKNISWSNVLYEDCRVNLMVIMNIFSIYYFQNNRMMNQVSFVLYDVGYVG